MLKFGVVGVGRIGKHHVTNLINGLCKDVKLVCCLDTDKEALDWVNNNYPKVHTHSSIEEMVKLEELDGVIISTPHYSHVDIAKYLIKNNINTLIEKPAAPSVKLCKEIIECANQNKNIKVGVSYNQRSNPLYKRAKELIDSKTLGQIERVNFIVSGWYRSQAYYNQGGWRASFNGEGGGCLMNQCIHQIDILQWLIGVPNSIVADCKTKDRNITTENEVTAILKYDGYNCVLTTTTQELSGENRLEIALDKGRIVIHETSMEVYFHDSQNKVNKETLEGYGNVASIKKMYKYGKKRAYLDRDDVIGQQIRSIRAFKDDILGKGKMLAPIGESVYALQIINGIYLSSYYKKEITLPINEEDYDRFLKEQIKRELL